MNSPSYERAVDGMEKLAKFMLLTCNCATYLVDRYGERRETMSGV
jgi:arsenic resistance protein ArsH